MTEYASLDEANQIRDRKQFDARPPDPLGKPWRWVPVVSDKPSFDPATQVREGPTTTVRDGDVLVQWTVRNKTAAELDAEKAALVDDLDRRALFQAITILYAISFAQENKIRELQGLQPIPTTVAGAETFLNGAAALARLSPQKLADMLKAAL